MVKGAALLLLVVVVWAAVAEGKSTCCYAYQSAAGKWFARRRVLQASGAKDGDCPDVDDEAKFIERGIQLSAQPREKMLMQLHFYGVRPWGGESKGEEGVTCRALAEQLNRNVSKVEPLDKAVVGCKGDGCGRTPRGDFCCYVWRQNVESRWTYEGYAAQDTDGRCKGSAVFLRELEEEQGLPNGGVFLRIPTRRIASYEECFKYTLEFGEPDEKSELLRLQMVDKPEILKGGVHRRRARKWVE